MRQVRLLVLLLACALPVEAAPPARTLSTSRQFAVYGDDALGRSAAAAVAEDTKASLLRALGLRDEWKAAVVVVLRQPSSADPGASPRMLSVGQTGQGLKVQLELLTGEAGRGLRFRDEIVGALLTELAFRSAPGLPPGAPLHLPPAWLVEGMGSFLETLDHEGVEAFPPGVAETLLRAGASFDALAFLARNPAELDGASHRLFRACAHGVVRMLLRELPGGRDALLALLAALPEAGRGAVADLPLFAPELAKSPGALAKWWAITLSRTAAPDAREFFSATETTRALFALLGPVEGQPSTALSVGSAPSANRQSLATLAARLSDPKQRGEAAARLTEIRGGLLGLRARAHPLLRPAVAEGVEIAGLAVRRRPATLIEARRRELASLCRRLERRQDDAADYLNWFEATQQRTSSGEWLFPPRPADAPPPRRDAVSAYLDAVEAEFR